MGFKTYRSYRNMEDEPAGRVLLDACDACNQPLKTDEDAPISLTNSPDVDLVSTLEDIGIEETDTLEAIRSKIDFALRRVDSGNAADTFTAFMTPAGVSEMQSEMNLVPELERRRVGVVVDKRHPRVIAQEMNITIREQLRTTLKEVLEWLEN